MTDDSVPIRKVADHFGLPLSTLHYWERRGLVTPHRRAGMRCYDTDQLYRIALIRLWRGTGTMSLDEIASLLAGPAADGLWRRTVVDRIAAIEAQRTRLGAAQTYLSHLLTCPHDEALDRCPGFRSRTPVPPSPS
ncbi:MerR family transcriptional regulator [Streptomyces uncialis]|uniref:MerR family transcriptional regulator n=1 Tax=Streptomyces uncialis TaxID=1048205 RepID=A0A1Q4V9C6_9ACTN|nr:MerR family transcriptional regulator [Streptomyces uncialis]OKH94451.1 MerR family transcriptional regulator [Streptomyces uncialis]